jgi:hypothetical protein
MSRSIVAALKHAFSDAYTEPDVHFHAAGSGQAAVCEDHRCNRPHLEL